MKIVFLRILCLFLGHKPYRIRWKNTYHINTNRKGGKKKGKGIYRWHNKHYEEYCERCGKFLKRR